MTPADRFVTTCAALWGRQWKASASEELDVAERTIYRWAAGTYPIPDGIWLKLAKFARERGEELNRISEALERIVA